MINIRDEVALKRDLQNIWAQGGVNNELYQAVATWGEMIRTNGGKCISGSWEDRDWPQLCESLLPLLLGVEDPEEKARSYFKDMVTPEEIGDPKFTQRAMLWETMAMYMDRGGISIKGVETQDVAGLVLRVIRELEPGIDAELMRKV